MLELSFRQAQTEDVSVIFSLSKELIDRYEDINEIDYEKVLKWVGKKISTNIHLYTCVFLGDTKVGYYCFSKNGEQWELDDLYVFSQYRGRGIGTQILRSCLQSADAPVFLYVFTENTSAIRLYEKFGFREAETVSPTRKILRWEG